ncbi:MAG: hypothetical protein EOS85_11525 [Mesorhizobium sp.]|nr:MAG: hypothetical protein EOS85_11525 [Mesorhizobium sp.]
MRTRIVQAGSQVLSEALFLVPRETRRDATNGVFTPEGFGELALEEADVPRRRLVEQDARKLSFPGGILFHMRAFMRATMRGLPGSPPYCARPPPRLDSSG